MHKLFLISCIQVFSRIRTQIFKYPKIYICIYRVFTGNCGKVTYYISGNASQKKSDILTSDIVTNYGEFESATALRREFRKHFKLSPSQLPRSYAFSRVVNRFMAFRLPGPLRTKIIEANINTVRNQVEEKPNSSISELRKNSPNSLPELVNTVERYAASINKDQIITATNDILPRTQACIESAGGAFEQKLKSFKRRLNR